MGVERGVVALALFETKEPRRRDHRGIVGREPRRRGEDASAQLVGRTLHRRSERAVAGHAAAEHDARTPVRARRTHGLGHERVDERVLKSSRDVRAVPLDVAARADRVKHGRLEAAERDIEEIGVADTLAAVEHGAREPESRRVALMRELLDVLAARVGEPHQLGRLVERLAGCVVARLTEQAVPAPRLHVQEQRVTSRDEQGSERRRGVRMLERGGEEMPFHVMHADHRLPERLRERLRIAHSHQQRSHESRRMRHRDRVDVGEGASRFGQRAACHWYDRREMLARCDLRHDSTEDAMHVLRQDHE